MKVGKSGGFHFPRPGRKKGAKGPKSPESVTKAFKKHKESVKPGKVTSKFKRMVPKRSEGKSELTSEEKIQKVLAATSGFNQKDRNIIETELSQHSNKLDRLMREAEKGNKPQVQQECLEIVNEIDNTIWLSAKVRTLHTQLKVSSEKRPTLSMKKLYSQLRKDHSKDTIRAEYKKMGDETRKMASLMDALERGYEHNQKPLPKEPQQ